MAKLKKCQQCFLEWLARSGRDLRWHLALMVVVPCLGFGLGFLWGEGLFVEKQTCKKLKSKEFPSDLEEVCA